MVTIYDIAKICNVSPSTVSKVLNNYETIPVKTKRKIEKAMEELNYIPNAGASSLSKGHSNNVGILAYFGTNISPFKHSLFSEILDSFQNEMNSKNYDLLFVSRNVKGKEKTFLENCISRNVDGVLLFGDLTNKELIDVINSDIPSVAFDYLGDKTSGVSSNNSQSMQELVQFLINLGHKHIGFIYGDKENEVTNLRIEAYKNTLIKNHINVDENIILESRYYETISLKDYIISLLDKKVTAIMFPDDYQAINGLKILQEMGIKCPEDISITGFDGIEIGQLINPNLCTVKQNTKEIGKALAKKLLYKLQHPKAKNEIEIIDSHLITGNSVKAIKI